MKRTKAFKKMHQRVVRDIRSFNKRLADDVFKDRFKMFLFGFNIVSYNREDYYIAYNVRCKDTKTGETKDCYFVDVFLPTIDDDSHGLRHFRYTTRLAMNDLIINSDFWKTYYKK